FADVPDRRSGQPIGVGQPAQAVAAEDAVHGRAWMTEKWPESIWPDTHPASGDDDPADRSVGQRAWSPVRRRGPVLEPAETFGAVPPQPLVGGGPADADRLRGECRRPAVPNDALHQEPSAERRQLGRTMKHESPPSVRSFDN